MRILVSGNIKAVRTLASKWPTYLGLMTTPGNGNSIGSLVATGLPWAADNGAYSGFDATKFRAFLAKLKGQPRCLFVVAPDVVGDARTTLDLFSDWVNEVAASGQPVACVGQDGAESLDVPWGLFQAWFIGGSTKWKLSQASADLTAKAKSLGKWVHMGRVNSMRRLTAAADMGCDSVDGSSYSRWMHRTITHRPDMSLERHILKIRELEASRRLFGVEPCENATN